MTPARWLWNPRFGPCREPAPVASEFLPWSDFGLMITISRAKMTFWLTRLKVTVVNQVMSRSRHGPRASVVFPRHRQTWLTTTAPTLRLSRTWKTSPPGSELTASHLQVLATLGKAKLNGVTAIGASFEWWTLFGPETVAQIWRRRWNNSGGVLFI